MANATRIIPVRVNPDGTMSFRVEHNGTRDVGFPTIGPLPAEEADAFVHKHMPEDLLNGEEAVQIRRIATLQDAEDGPGTEYLLVIGNDGAFTPPTSLPEGSRWVGPGELKAGPLPEGISDSSLLRHVYTHSMDAPDLAGLMLGMQAARALRHPDYPLLIGSPEYPLATMLESPAMPDLIFSPEIDRKLPPLHLPPNVNARPNRSFTATRREVLRRLGQVASLASKIPMLPSGALETMARRLLHSGGQPKPV